MRTKRANEANIEAVASQIGGTLLPDSDQWFNRFQVKSASSSRLYVIAQRRSDNVWGCSCPGWINYRKCKHLTDVLKRLSDVAASPVARAYDSATLGMLASARKVYLELGSAKKVVAPAVKGWELDL
jgi:hypothetical protein